ncbi:putative F-box/LRR-repeat protein 23 [Vicia villosa]|uniref:putative F-box/LRR-repeat protein 23 n=1 Tax=Vicia villosa TaxID=3911 RepID=UPI00273B3C33|nr:putative F-box/LRR-repeat protein 23 [Vicia villosa]
MEFYSETTTGPNWLDLPKDLTANILKRLGTFEILASASRVCPLWWNICKDPLMWRTIHMPHVRNYKYLDNICCIAVERSCGQLEDIDIERFATDNLLECIANNGSHLLSLRMVDCWDISNKGFREAVSKLSQLEMVDISLSFVTGGSLEVLGRSCPLLKSLKFHLNRGLVFSKSDATAFIIAETMPALCHLDIKRHVLSNVGLLAILDKCHLLKSLDIRRCPYLELNDSLEKRFADQIKDLKRPDDELESYWFYETSDDE